MTGLVLDATQQSTGYGQSDMIMMIGMVVLFGAIMYFMIYLPQKKRDKKLKEQMDKLVVGDKVVTIGGLVGIVAHITEDDVTIYTSAANTPVTFTKSAIQTVIPRNPDASSDKKSDSKKEKKSEKKES
jgi:preprotein translocase subunit YajC